MQIPPFPPRRSSRRAFTLIELLTVIAIIGILAAIIIPTTSSARTSARKARTRGQFSQWGAAIETFRQEYGYYPTFAMNNKVNGTTTPGSLAPLHQFHDTLVGTRRDGSALPTATAGTPPPPQVQNPRRIAFLSFTDADIAPLNFTDTTIRGLIRDAFDNANIAVLVDRNLDGKIALGAAGGDGLTTLPSVSPPDNTALNIVGPTTGATGDFPTGANAGVRAGVIFYCAPPKATGQADLLMSWK